jgi:mannose-1-phosphate guanylyltransferase/phosphomannomutase
MRAVIMAGGFGTRLRPLTSEKPKPMVPVANRPMMEHIVRLLARHGFTDIVTLLYYQPGVITGHFGDGSDFGVKMRYVRPEGDLGTAGAVRYADTVGFLGERTLVISGDVLTDLDLSAALEFHDERDAEATIVLTRVENPLAFGVVITRPDGRIERFLEKPTWGQVFSDTVNTGIYVLEPEVLARVPTGRAYDFSKDLFPLMLSKKAALYGHVAEGYWRDIGNSAEYATAHRDVLDGAVALDPPGEERAYPKGRVFLASGAAISGSAKVKGTVYLGEDAVVSGEASLEDCVIGARCEIGSGADVKRSVLWDDATIGRRATVTEAIVCERAVVGDRAVVEEDAIIASGARVGSRALVRTGLKVWPGKEVDPDAVLTESLVWGDRWRSELFTDAKVSGLANVELTPEFTARVGAAFGAVLGPGATVLAGRDASAATRMTHRALAAGLMSGGVNVHDLQHLPIPILRFRLATGGAQGGVHVKHAPDDPSRIDVIFFESDGTDLTTAKAKDIERLVAREDFHRAEFDSVGGIAFPPRAAESYRTAFLAALDAELLRARRFRIVVDFANGGAAAILPSILGSLGCKAVVLNGYVEFGPTHRTAKETKEELRELRSAVRSFHADAGFLLDPGAECLTAVTNRGVVLAGDDLLVALLALVIERGGVSKVAVPVVATRIAEELAEGKANVLRVRNDHLGMMAAAEKSDIVIGTRGGVIVPSFGPGVDAMYGLAHVLELLASDGRTLDEVWRSCPRPRVGRAVVPCPRRRMGRVMRRLMEATSDAPRLLVDGVRFDHRETTVTILPERQRAAFAVTAEHDDLKTARRTAREFASKVRKWRDAGERTRKKK